ncbi:hypothetical protein NC652_036839 [Populus alba x Populus x berolinensis]|nr:hypothetical protein NC652_036839 [Populus alba x Populus x berolinensis]
MCLLGITYPVDNCSDDGHFDGHHPCFNKLDGGFISFSPTLFVKDLLFVWPNGISGFSFVHIHIVHITIISVDFSANPDGAGFFEGLTT